MFEINAGDLPFVRTRQALLILDLQNDFVSTGCLLPVEQPPDFVERIVDLVPTFRKTGCVFWIRSQFEANRPINGSSADAELVITDAEASKSNTDNDESIIHRATKTPKRMLELYEKIMAENGRNPDSGLEALDGETEEPYNNETFLTIPFGEEPRIAIPMTAGNNFTQSIAQIIDATRDVVFAKSHYSAFKSGTLLQTLRGQFVTELFICGAMTNISIFATVMEAAKYGFQITLIDDCLGYRSKARHDEARRQLIEAAGCEVLQCSDIVDMVNTKLAVPQNRPTDRRRGRGNQEPQNLQDMMAGLKLKNENGPPRSNGRPSSSTKPPVSATNGKPVVADELLDSIPSTSDESIPILPQFPKKAEEGERKRVPNKIKSRRRRSDPDSVKNGEVKNGKKSLSPTHATLSGATEALKTVTRNDSDSEIIATSSMAKQPDLNTLLKVDTLGSTERTKEHSEPPAKGRSPIPRTTKPVPSCVVAVPAVTIVDATSKENVDIESKLTLVAPPDSKQTSSGSSTPETPSQDTYHICDGDSMIIHNLLPKAEAEDIFERVRDEVQWQRMSHQGGEVPRLVAVQGIIGEDGSMPIYRHPADESPPLLPFSPTVVVIKAEVEKRLGHKVNHCLIQFYRSGTDYISEHSDKTLDITPNTFIANISLGAMRAMTFRTKKPLKNSSAPSSDEITPRMSCKAPLPHNSMCKMSLITNEKWLHSIRQDKRLAREKSEAELAFGGCRISLTFRLIGSFLSSDESKIWGQGAVAKSKENARPVVNGSTPEAEHMIIAFGKENHSSIFDWQDTYGAGFDVLHISNTKKLYMSGDPVPDLRVKLALAAYEIEYIEGRLNPLFSWKDSYEGKNERNAAETPDIAQVRFMDNDLAKSEVEGDLAILLYLDATFPPTTKSFTGSSDNSSPINPTSNLPASQNSQPNLHAARKFTRLAQADRLLQQWRTEQPASKSFRKILGLWEGYAKDYEHALQNKGVLGFEAGIDQGFMTGAQPGVVDWALWPVLRDCRDTWWNEEGVEGLRAYFERVAALDVVKKVLGEDDVVKGEGKGKGKEGVEAV